MSVELAEAAHDFRVGMDFDSDFGFVSRIAGVVHQLIAKPATHWPNKRDGANRRPALGFVRRLLEIFTVWLHSFLSVRAVVAHPGR